jgi:hypothetical protein
MAAGAIGDGEVAMMSREEKPGRVAPRGRASRLPVYRIPGGYAVPSRTLSGVAWVVAVIDGELRCDCPGFVHCRACAHAEAVRRHLTAGTRAR